MRRRFRNAALLSGSILLTPAYADAQHAREPLLPERYFITPDLKALMPESNPLSGLPIEPTPYATIDRPVPLLEGVPDRTRRELTMYPPGLGRTPGEDGEVSASDVLVRNFGAEEIHFTYLMTTQWQSEEVGPGERKRLHCDTCSDSIKIAFNDGAEDRSVDAGLGLSYAFYWGTGDKRWHLEPAGTALRRIGFPQKAK
jgi:hypothetical protein